MMMIIQKEKQEFVSILARLDRLEDAIIKKYSYHHIQLEDQERPLLAADKWKSLSCALEEVDRKGNITERLQNLENRLLQLNKKMETSNTIYTSGFQQAPTVLAETVSCMKKKNKKKKKDFAIISREQEAWAWSNKSKKLNKPKWFPCFSTKNGDIHLLHNAKLDQI